MLLFHDFRASSLLCASTLLLKLVPQLMEAYDVDGDGHIDYGKLVAAASLVHMRYVRCS